MTQQPRSSRRRIYLATTGAATLVLLTVLVVRTLTSSAPAVALTDTLIGPPPATASAEPGACTPPDPLTPRQLREAARAPVVAPAPLGTARPAAAPLRALAKSITAGACDTSGRYDYVQMRQWVIDTRAAGGRATLTTALLQYEHWLAADGSGRAIAVTTRTPAAENPPTDDIYPPGASPVTPGPMPADARLAHDRLNSITALAAGPHAALQAVADLNQWQVPGRAARAALLNVLADTDSLTYHGTVTDRAGRPGFAVAATSNNGASRDLLLIDPTSGNLLAHEQTALRDPGKLGITAPTVLSYTLYVAQDHTATVQQR
ncbi:hypothetical protein GCM10010172_31110 [Paractinoplanes ferrugineus]|uniref:CU044_5270 family protein n=1 Tax=Paractinoplanes ferrugineus TaxID=113564 RepID=A0A919J6F4_9ACTN|nr:hypothetical protein [Actinoplanes ferrugineus]GIE14197.1 hypothetical protein Afe05nite_60370 [Actinoplanes ferrugineus]